MTRHQTQRSFPTLLGAVALVAAFTVAARRCGYNVGGRTVVRCREGHLFTTLWIPGVKLKAIDLVVARIQRCPVGKHWSLVVPVRDSDLSRRQLADARSHHDMWIP